VWWHCTVISMYEPTRGGTRGGQAEFKWSDVSQDKDREHYLGHSINAPTGRWQKNKDVHWYNREKKQTDEEKQLEIAKIKEAEREAMSVALCVFLLLFILPLLNLSPCFFVQGFQTLETTRGCNHKWRKCDTSSWSAAVRSSHRNKTSV
jgi:hypothetical protein